MSGKDRYETLATDMFDGHNFSRSLVDGLVHGTEATT
jgi:hypothetical protein